MGKRLLVAIVLVLVLAVLANRLGLRNAANSTAAPQSIADFSLQKLVTGPAAIAEMTQLHGKDVGITGGWVGYYEHGAVIWTAETKDEQVASGLVTAMEQRITDGNRIFTDLKRTQTDGLTIYSVVGMGQQHFFFRQNDKVVWIASPVGAENEFLRQALKTII